MSSDFCTTVRILDGRPMWWRLHKARLRIFSSYLNIDIDLDAIEKFVHDISQPSVIRIEIQTDGSWGFSQRSTPKSLSLSAHPVIHYPDPINGQIKWLERVIWDRIKAERAVDVLLLLDEQNQYLEMCIGNAFIYVPNENTWYTPPIQLGILCGTMRMVVITQLKKMKQQLVEETLIFNQDHEVWMSNAIRGMIPISLVDTSMDIVQQMNFWGDCEEHIVDEFTQQMGRTLK